MAEQAGEIHELKPQHKPEFDGGSFTIEYMSPSTKGFEIRTNGSERRKPSDKSLPFTPEQKEELKEAVPGQMRYAKGDVAKLMMH